MAEKGKKRRGYMRKHQAACSRNRKKEDGEKSWNDGMSADGCGGGIQSRRRVVEVEDGRWACQNMKRLEENDG
jgi:hypothetical protein